MLYISIIMHMFIFHSDNLMPTFFFTFSISKNWIGFGLLEIVGKRSHFGRRAVLDESSLVLKLLRTKTV